MSMSVLLQPAPGWYPDPAGVATYRWWDGDTWTAGTHAGTQDGTPGLVPSQLFAEPDPTPPVAAPAAAPIYAEPALPAPDFAEPAMVPEPVGRPAPVRQQAPRAPVATAKTRWSSLLVAFPFVYPVVVGMVTGLAYAGGFAANLPALGIVGGVVAVAALIPPWVFAEYDRRELVARGFEPVPSIAWMLLLPPVAYLLARRGVVGPRL